GIVEEVSHSPTLSKALPGTSVFLARQDSTREARTDAAGLFVFRDLEPGAYRLSVEASDLGGSDVMIDLEHGGCYRALITLDRVFGSYNISGRGARETYTRPTPSKPRQ